MRAGHPLRREQEPPQHPLDRRKTEAVGGESIPRPGRALSREAEPTRQLHLLLGSRELRERHPVGQFGEPADRAAIVHRVHVRRAVEHLLEQVHLRGPGTAKGPPVRTPRHHLSGQRVLARVGAEVRAGHQPQFVWRGHRRPGAHEPRFGDPDPAPREGDPHPLEGSAEGDPLVAAGGIGHGQPPGRVLVEEEPSPLQEAEARRLRVVGARRPPRLGRELQLGIPRWGHHAARSSCFWKRCSPWSRRAPSRSICRRLAGFSSAIQVTPTL